MIHLIRHGRFYLAALAGLLVYPLALAGPLPFRILLSGDVFYAVYLTLMIIFASGLDTGRLRRRAAVEDEGSVLIIGLTAVAVVFSIAAVFLMLNNKSGQTLLIGLLAAVSVPLSWATIHTLGAFHYANLYYAPDRTDGKGDAGGLDFPQTPEPGIADFAYYSFVVGMTAQVSDVQVTSARMRRPTLVHGVVSFFYNTVLIALSVNAVVALAN